MARRVQQELRVCKDQKGAKERLEQTAHQVNPVPWAHLVRQGREARLVCLVRLEWWDRGGHPANRENEGRWAWKVKLDQPGHQGFLVRLVHQDLEGKEGKTDQWASLDLLVSLEDLVTRDLQGRRGAWDHQAVLECWLDALNLVWHTILSILCT